MLLLVFLTFFHEKKSAWKNSQYFQRYTQKMARKLINFTFFKHKSIFFSLKYYVLVRLSHHFNRFFAALSRETNRIEKFLIVSKIWSNLNIFL